MQKALQLHYGYLFEDALLKEIADCGSHKKIQQGSMIMDIGDGITLILSKNKNVKNDISVLKCKNRLVLTLYTLFVILVLLIKIGILLLTLFIFGLTLKII